MDGIGLVEADSEDSDVDTIRGDENGHEPPETAENSRMDHVHTEENVHQYPEEEPIFSNLQQEDVLSENS